MPIAKKNVGTPVYNLSSFTSTPTLPTVDSGDLMLAFIFGTSGTGVNNIIPNDSTTGWQKILLGTASGKVVALFKKIATAGEANPVFRFHNNGVDTSTSNIAIIMTFSGAGADIHVGRIGQINEGNGSTHNSPGIEMVASDSLALYLDVCGTTTALDTPSGWTEWFDEVSTYRISGGTKSVSKYSNSGDISITGGAAAWFQFQLEIRGEHSRRVSISS